MSEPLRPYMMEAGSIPDPVSFFADWLRARGLDRGRVVELGASCGQSLFGRIDHASYLNIDLAPNKHIPTVVQDVCGDIFTVTEEGGADVIYSNSLLEHVPDPFAAAANITRLLAPKGVCFIRVPFAYRFHPMPNDYWRFSPEGLKVLFRGLECLAAELDSVIRRKNFTGQFKSGLDQVPQDEFGGWRESWMAYFIGRKPEVSEIKEAVDGPKKEDQK